MLSTPCYDGGKLRLGGKCMFCQKSFMMALSAKAEEVVKRNACADCIDKIVYDKGSMNVQHSKAAFKIVRQCASLGCGALFTVCEIPANGACCLFCLQARVATLVSCADMRKSPQYLFMFCR